nr:transposase [uncultured Lachnoanaerobaculum sp.]
MVKIFRHTLIKIWSDGYFACSIGEVSSSTIQKYIESQG